MTYYVANQPFEADGVQYVQGQQVPNTTDNVDQLVYEGLATKFEGAAPTNLPQPDPPPTGQTTS